MGFRVSRALEFPIIIGYFNHYFVDYNEIFSSKIGAHVMYMKSRMYRDEVKILCRLSFNGYV